MEILEERLKNDVVAELQSFDNRYLLYQELFVLLIVIVGCFCIRRTLQVLLCPCGSMSILQMLRTLAL